MYQKLWETWGLSGSSIRKKGAFGGLARSPTMSSPMLVAWLLHGAVCRLEPVRSRFSIVLTQASLVARRGSLGVRT